MKIRHQIQKHFTASAVVIYNDHILLVHHKRIGAWLPPGGHIEELEMPHEAAERETLEETGIAVEVVSSEIPETNDPDAFFLPQPLCIHSVKALEKGVELYHIDIAYLCHPLNLIEPNQATYNIKHEVLLPPISHSQEVKEARWVKLNELSNLPLAKNVPELIWLINKAKVPSY